jgi:ABC-type branched-subunit amino acid transport system substrate-binding protein
MRLRLRRGKRFGPATESAIATLAVVLGVGVLLSILTIVPASSSSPSGLSSQPGVVDQGSGGGPAPAPGATTGPGTKQGAGSPGGSNQGGAPVPGAPQGNNLLCAAGKNGGNTDVGVTGSSIKLAATVVDDGPGASFLGPVRTAMNAVKDQVNRSGGICGRQLDLELRNDSWQANTGCQFIKNFVQGDRVFALAVVPSSEGLRACNGYIQQQGVPVVGTDGMLIHQYQNPWIWPVATSTMSTMHVMAKNAYDRGARRFGLVFDAKYHFGVEGAYAFDKAVKRLTGHDIAGFDSSLKSCSQDFCGIQPGQASYTTNANQFNNSCYRTVRYGRGRCDFVGFLLEPDTALSWFGEGRPADPTVGFGGAQPLFTRPFAEACKTACDGMWLYTGYTPPQGPYAGQAAISDYVNTVRRASSSADVDNQFLEGGYVGMKLLVAALQRLGPAVTRAGLKATLDAMTYKSGLAPPLTWRPGQHFANTGAMAWEIEYNQGFNGWRNKTGFLADPWVGQDIPPGE